MGQYTSYWLYQKYETRGEQDPIPCYPNVYSVDGDGTMVKVVKIEEDPACGYAPTGATQYRWVNIPITQDYICDECGQTPVEPIYQWERSDDTVCVYSGTPAPTGTTKLQVTYSDSATREVYCDDDSGLGTGDTRAYGYQESAMTSAVIGDCVTSIGDDAFYWCVSLSGLTMPTGITNIGGHAFFGAVFSSITLGNAVTSIGSGAFANCTRLTSISIPSGVTSISDNVFNNCNRLASINIPSGITNIGNWAFYRCRSFTGVTIPSGVTSIGQGAFRECSGLTSITVEAITPPTLGVNAFADTPISSGTGIIYVPCESVDAYKAATNWSTYASRMIGIQPCGFKYKLTLSNSNVISGECDSSLTLGSAATKTFRETTVTAEIGDCVTTIGQRAFYYFYNLTSVDIPDSVTIIGVEAFIGCGGLTSVDIPDSVTSIGVEAFRNCYGLTSVTIPSGVTGIGERAFYLCDGLTSIICNALTPPTLYGGSVFDNTNNCPIYVPVASVDAYKADSRWSEYRNRIQSIP